MLSHLIKNHVLREKSMGCYSALAGRGVGDYAEIPPLSGSRQSTPDENSASVFLSRKKIRNFKTSLCEVSILFQDTNRNQRHKVQNQHWNESEKLEEGQRK